MKLEPMGHRQNHQRAGIMLHHERQHLNIYLIKCRKPGIPLPASMVIGESGAVLAKDEKKYVSNLTLMIQE
jgi:hypothetical protein